MRLFRCYPRIAGARPGRPGHWSFVPRPQTQGRWDNAELYDSWYFSRSAVGAVAESFYSLNRWIPEVFLTPAGQPRAIAEFEFTGSPLLDLDDPTTLLDLDERPSGIVIANLAHTQQLARRIFETHGGRHAGISWWSSQLPSETSVVLWVSDAAPPAGLKLIGIQNLSVDHPAVVDAATKLYRRLG